MVCSPILHHVWPGPLGHGVVGCRVRDLAMYLNSPLDLVPLGRQNKIRCAGLEGQLSEGGHCWNRAATQAGRATAVVCKTLVMEGQAK